MLIKKRNGVTVEFDSGKIIQAISKACQVASIIIPQEEVEQMIINIINELSSQHIVNVEEIQEKVIQQLLFFRYIKVALEYTKYRERRAIARENKVDALEIVNTYIHVEDDLAVHENSSTSYSIQGLNSYIIEKNIEKKWLSLCSDEIKEAYNRGRIHLHDISFLGGYCAGWDLRQLLEEGFTGVPGKLSCKPAKHFGTALSHISNFIFTLQTEFAGAQAFSNVNSLLAPYVYKDQLTYKQVKQYMQEFVFNLNIPNRTGLQAPFSNITMDLDVTKTPFADDLVLIAGETVDDKCYSEFQKEAEWINLAFVEVMLEGDAAGAMHSYPIPTFNVTKDFPWKNKFGDTLLKLVAKYGSPYFANFITSDVAESSIRSMCCRLRIDNNAVMKYVSEFAGGLEDEDYEKNQTKGGGFFGAAPNTGSIGVVTLNLCALMQDTIDKGNVSLEEFKQTLNHYMNLSIEFLQKKRKQVELYMEMGLYPYAKFYLKHIKKRTGHYFTQHFSTIAVNAGHEAIYLFRKALGEEDNIGIVDEKGLSIAQEILQYMSDYIIELQKQHRVLINLEQAPAESAGVKLLRKSGIDPFKNGFYTNSTWIPAWEKVDIFDQVMHQGKLNENYTGGSSFHTYSDGDLMKSYRDLYKYILFAFENTKLPYLTISPVYTICEKDGYIPGKHEVCPICGSNHTQIYERIVGYYRSHTNFNNGRLAETKKRYYHKSV